MQTPSLFIKLYLSVKTLYSQAESTLKFALKRLSTFFSFPKAQVFEKSFKNAYHNSWTIVLILFFTDSFLETSVLTGVDSKFSVRYVEHAFVSV